MPPIRFQGPFIGVNRRRHERALRLEEARDALNLVLDEGTLRKRDGHDLVGTAPNGQPILGFHDYKGTAGLDLLLVKAGNQLYKVDRVSGAFTTIGGPDLHATNPAQMKTLNYRTYVVDGGTPKVTDGTTLNDWLISPPGFAPDLSAASGSGNLTGTFDYKITFYSTTWAQHSPASPETNESDTALSPPPATSPITVDTQNVALSNIPGSSDNRVDEVHIWRRNIGLAEGDWFRVGIVDNPTPPATTTFTDDRPVPESFIAPLTYTTTLKQWRYLTVNLGVVFAAGNTDDPTQVWFSAVDDPTPLGFFTADDEVTGLVTLRGRVVVFTRTSTYVLTGNSATTFDFQKILPDIGCYCPNSIVVVDDVLYWWWDRSVWAFDFARPVEVGLPVQPLVEDRNFSRDDFVQGAVLPQHNAIVWTYSASGSATNDKTLVYFYRNSDPESGRLSWMPWDVPLATRYGVSAADNEPRKFYAGRSDGSLWRYGATTGDDTAAISWFWQVPRIPLGVPGLLKQWNDVHIDLTKQSDGHLSLSAAYDDGEFETVEDLHDMRDELMTRFLGAEARTAALKLEESGAGPAEVVHFQVEVEPELMK